MYLFFDKFSCRFPSKHGCNSPLGIACKNVLRILVKVLVIKTIDYANKNRITDIQDNKKLDTFK